MLISRFILLWLMLAGGVGVIVFGWNWVMRQEVLRPVTKVVVTAVIAFVLALFIFVMET